MSNEKREAVYSAIGRRLRAARIARNMSPANLGAALDPPQKTASIGHIENGRRRIMAHTLLQMADALGVCPCALAGRKPNA